MPPFSNFDRGGGGALFLIMQIGPIHLSLSLSLSLPSPQSSLGPASRVSPTSLPGIAEGHLDFRNLSLQSELENSPPRRGGEI